MKSTRNSQSSLTVAAACAEIMATVEPESEIQYLLRTLRIAGFQKAPHEDGTYVIPCAGDPYKYLLRVRAKDMLGNELSRVTAQFRACGVLILIPTREHAKELAELAKFLRATAVASTTSTNFIAAVEKPNSALGTKLMRCPDVFARGTMESGLAEYWRHHHTIAATVEPLSEDAPISLGPVVKAVLRKLPWLELATMTPNKRAATMQAKESSLQLKVLVQVADPYSSTYTEHGIGVAGIWLFENYVMRIGKVFPTANASIEYITSTLSKIAHITKESCQSSKTPVEFKKKLRSAIESAMGVSTNYPWSQKAIEYFDEEHCSSAHKATATVEPMSLETDSILKYLDRGLNSAHLFRDRNATDRPGIQFYFSWQRRDLAGTHVPYLSVVLSANKDHDVLDEIYVYLPVNPILKMKIHSIGDLQHVVQKCVSIDKDLQRIFADSKSGADYARRFEDYLAEHWQNVQFPYIERDAAVQYYDKMHYAHATVEPGTAADSFNSALQNARRLGMTRTGNNNRFNTYMYDSNPCSVPGLCLHLTKHEGFGAVFAVFDVPVFDIDDDTSKTLKLIAAMKNVKRVLDAGVVQSTDGSKFKAYVVYAMTDLFGADVAARIQARPEHAFRTYWETFKH